MTCGLELGLVFGESALDRGGTLQDETRAKIFGADILVGHERGRRALLKNRALVQKVGTVGDGKSFADVGR